MPIIIKNMTAKDATERGLHQYSVQINNGPIIATFNHYREHGLANCLRLAAKAVDEVRQD